ncbi:recombination endonuclease subunit [Cyanophage P-TIM40]|uniref:Recombination endonuclease subunit n=1 Tax=Cyanophage P-TIM40 TaxID=1589733 RepID=A0A0C5AMX4_9CAUD|nr:SbcC-like subunit of palindrome specific endonuclease [Cyanophage P-TIM40]AJK27575.1 recombination endonuclease subunit [Cyanophage P-TIM40]
MIIFEKVKWKNFLSTGNGFTELDLEKFKSTVVYGANGAGKSTMLDALCFVLFNKPFRKITKSQLVNTINERECVVECEFRVGQAKYKVIRGIKPNVFEIYRNGTLIDQTAANNDYQKYLEQKILKFNFKSFTQVVILGSSTFVPFMQLSAPHRRDVIEDLLDIKVFSRMNLLLKDRLRDIRNEVKECEHTVSLHQKTYDMQNATVHRMESMMKSHKEDLASQLMALKEENFAVEKNIADTETSLRDLTDKLASSASSQAQYGKMREYITSVKTKVTRNLSDLDFFLKNDSCPTCTQTISETIKQEKVEAFTVKDEDYQKKLEEMETVLSKLDKKVKEDTKMAESYQRLKGDLKAYNKEKKTIASRLNAIKGKKTNTVEFECEQDKLAQYKKELDKTVADCAEVNAQESHHKVVSTLLRDNGIKSKIIKKFIPIINQHINKYLQDMDFYVNFTLDEEFNEVIKSRHRDIFSYASFSEGEKQKIDLALLFTWRDIARMKNSTATNLLLLDEVFDSSLDANATTDLLKILRRMSDNTNIYVISHKMIDILVDAFESSIEFVKESDFSSLKYRDNP